MGYDVKKVRANLKKVLAESRYSARQVSEATGATPHQARKWIAGANLPTGERRRRLCAFLKVRWEDIVSGRATAAVDDHAPENSLPLVAEGGAATGGFIPAGEVNDEPLHIPPGAHRVRIRGDSMATWALDGQYAVAVDEDPLDGEVGVIDLVDDGQLVKRIRFETIVGKRYILAESINRNPAYRTLLFPTEKIRRMRKVIGVLSGGRF